MAALRKRSAWILLVLVVLPILAFWLYYDRQVRQQRLDRALLQAIKKQDTQTAIALLNQGADANTTDRPYVPITFKGLLNDLWIRLRPGKLLKVKPDHPSALVLVYGPVSFSVPDTSIRIVTEEYPDTQDSIPLPNKRMRAPLVSALLAHGADLKAREKSGTILLESACLCSDAKTVEILLKHHVDPNAMGVFGYPLLMCTQDYDCARLLLEFGADANARSSNARTRLMYIENPQLYPLLIQQGADPNAQDDEGQTALIRLFTSFYVTDDEIRTGVRFLLQHGAKVSLKDKTGETALDYAREGKSNWMARGPAIDGLDKSILSALEEALKKEQRQTVH